MLKIEAVLPTALRERAGRSRIFAPAFGERLQATERIDRLHEAVNGHQVLRLDYMDSSGATSIREIEPLCLAFWGGVWTVGAWCRRRAGFRSFRPDRITSFAATGEFFEETAERGLAAYLRAVGAEALED